MAHIHKDIDFVVNAYIVHGGKVLLVLHRQLNIWLPIGGHVELDEDTDQALLREVKEECGLDIKVVSKRSLSLGNSKGLLKPEHLDIHRISTDPSHRHIALSYFALASSDEAVLAPQEHHDIRWFSEKELGDPKLKTEPYVIMLAKEALK